MKINKIVVFILLSILFIISGLVCALADEEVMLTSDFHEHECEYVAENNGYHIVKCLDENCDYERSEECRYEKVGKNTWACTVCKGIKPLYLVKNGHCEDVMLKSGEMSRLHFRANYYSDKEVKDSGFVIVNSGGQYYNLASRDYYTSYSKMEELQFLSDVTLFDLLRIKSYTDNGTHAHGYFVSKLDKESARLSFSNAKNADENYIDMSDYDTAVIEYKSRTKVENGELFINRFCNTNPVSITVIECEDGKYLYRELYNIKAISEGGFDSNSYGLVEFIANLANENNSKSVYNTAEAEDISIFLENTGQTAVNTEFHASIIEQTESIDAYYGDTVNLVVTGQNFSHNSRWYYKTADGEISILNGNEEFFIERKDNTDFSVVSLRADKITDNAEFYFKSKGADDSEYVVSNPMNINIIDDPIMHFRVYGICSPVALEPLDDEAEIEVTTYKGKVISANSIIEWKNSGCTNEEKPELKAGKAASNNTYYTAVINWELNDFKDGKARHPFIEGEFSVSLNGDEADDKRYQIYEDLSGIKVEYGKGAKDYVYKDRLLAKPDDYNAFARTKAYDLKNIKPLKKYVKCDSSFECEVEFSEIIEFIEFSKGKPDSIYLNQIHTITNQNNFLFKTEKLDENYISIAGTPGRAGTVYESEFEIISANYEKAVLDFVIVATELEKQGRYGVLNRPGLYDSEGKLIYDWNTLIDLGLIDCSDTVLYEADPKIGSADGDLLILSRKLTQIRKDAFKDSNLHTLEFDSNIIKLGAGALSAVDEIKYEGSVKDFKALIAASANRCANKNIPIYFVDYKEVVPEIIVNDNIYDGNKKVADAVIVSLAEDTQYTYYVNQNKLSDLKYSSKNLLKPTEYILSYQNNRNAGLATIKITDKKGLYEFDYEFEIKKAKAPVFDNKEYEYLVSAFTGFVKEFDLIKYLPKDAGEYTITKNLKTISNDTTDNIIDNKLLSVSGIGSDIATVYESDFSIVSENYENLELKVKVICEAFGKGKKLYIDDTETDFIEAINNNYITIDDKGYITYISPLLKGSLNIPDSVECAKYSGYINGFAKLNLSGLGLDDVIMSDNYHIEKIPDRLCCGNAFLKSVVLPKSLIEIGEEAFSDCRELALVYIPESVSSIGRAAFRNDTAIKAATKSNYGLRLLNGNLSELKDGVFEGDSGLCDINHPFKIPANVTTITGDALSAVAYIEYAGAEEVISSQINKGFKYDGQKIRYPYELDRIEIENKEYVYDNKPLEPKYSVISKAFIYISYEDEGGQLVSKKESFGDYNEADAVISPNNLKVEFSDNNGAGTACINAYGKDGYYGKAEAFYEIKKGDLSKYMSSEKTLLNMCCKKKGDMDIEIIPKQIIEGINLGNTYFAQYSEIENDPLLNYEIAANGNMKLNCRYSLTDENKKKPVRVFSAIMTIKSDNYNDFSFRINEDLYLGNEEILEGKGKNARLSSYVDDEGNLVYKITEQLGCQIALNNLKFDIKDYLPAVIKDEDVKLLKMDYDDEEIKASYLQGGNIGLDGYCDYPHSGILYSKFSVKGEECGEFLCEFVINITKPVQIYVNRNVFTNMSLNNEQINLFELFPKEVEKESIDFVSAKGIYRGNACFENGVVTLSNMVKNQGRIYTGYYSGADKSYQSYRLTLSIDATDAVASTVEEKEVMLTNGMSARYIEGYIYTGKKIAPLPQIYDGSGKLLKYKTDYTIKYINNTKANMTPTGEEVCQMYDRKLKKYVMLKPQMIITFKKDYKALPKQTLYFYIFQKDLSDYEVRLQNDNTVKKSIRLKNNKLIKYIADNNNKKLKKTDYVAEYLPENKGYITNDNELACEIKIRGINNYCGYFIEHVKVKK